MCTYATSMAVHLIDISGPELEAIRTLVQGGRFAAVEDFLQVAVRNQLVLERARQPGMTLQPAPVAAPPNQKRISKAAPDAMVAGQVTWDMPGLEPFEVENLPASAIPTLPAPGLGPGPLFGQFYRFLPVKLVLRALAVESAGGFPEFKGFSKKAVAAAKLLAEVLAGLPVRTSPLSLTTGLPSEDRDAGKSAARFEAQYVGRVRSSGQPDGFGFAVGFLAAAKEDGASMRVGLTEAGLAFVRLRNPTLDDRETTPLSSEEARFIVKWFRDNLPDEFTHMREVVAAVRRGSNTPTSMAQAMMQFYEHTFRQERWTPPKANLTRSGAVSRLIEMQLLGASKEGQRVMYAVNEALAAELGL